MVTKMVMMKLECVDGKGGYGEWLSCIGDLMKMGLRIDTGSPKCGQALTW